MVCVAVSCVMKKILDVYVSSIYNKRISMFKKALKKFSLVCVWLPLSSIFSTNPHLVLNS